MIVLRGADITSAAQLTVDETALIQRCSTVFKYRESGRSDLLDERDRLAFAAMEKNCPPCDQVAMTKIPLVAEELALKIPRMTAEDRQRANDYLAKIESECSGSDLTTKALYGAAALVGFGLLVYLVRK